MALGQGPSRWGIVSSKPGPGLLGLGKARTGSGLLGGGLTGAAFPRQPHEGPPRGAEDSHAVQDETVLGHQHLGGHRVQGAAHGEDREDLPRGSRLPQWGPAGWLRAGGSGWRESGAGDPPASSGHHPPGVSEQSSGTHGACGPGPLA
uniref:PDZ domain containing 7 n=1 Tax=Pipistrellus kuhlii TaxID=59472 RepID=A0A7J7VC15_PIPKU|nr:PDZ domain containing 7 [Pipistrellus kuhlii]